MSPTLKRKPFAQWLAVLAGGDLKNLRGALAIVKCFRRTQALALAKTNASKQDNYATDTRKHIFHGHHNSGDKKPKKHSTTIMAIISSSQLWGGSVVARFWSFEQAIEPRKRAWAGVIWSETNRVYRQWRGCSDILGGNIFGNATFWIK